MDRVAIAVVDLALSQRRADRPELVAGREERDAQLPVDGDFADAERGHHSELGRVDTLPGPEDDLPRLEILAGEAPVLPRLGDCARGDAHPPILLVRAFLHHDGVGTLGHHATGEDAHTLAGADGDTAGLAGERFADARERGVAIGRKVGEADRVAVHRRVVVAGHGKRRHHVGGEHPAERGADVDALGRGDRRQERADQRARPFDRHRVRIVVVGAGELAQGFGLAHGVVAVEEWGRNAGGRIIDDRAMRWQPGGSRRPARESPRVQPRVAAAASSSAVLMLRNASASSSKPTSTTRSAAYHASILRPPLSQKRCEIRQQIAANQREHRVGLVERLRHGELRALARQRCVQARHEIGGKKRRIAGHRDDELAACAGHARMQSGERPREAADRVGNHRMAEGARSGPDSGWR